MLSQGYSGGVKSMRAEREKDAAGLPFGLNNSLKPKPLRGPAQFMALANVRLWLRVQLIDATH
jgi:hypothetical protein